MKRSGDVPSVGGRDWTVIGDVRTFVRQALTASDDAQKVADDTKSLAREGPECLGISKTSGGGRRAATEDRKGRNDLSAARSGLEEKKVRLFLSNGGVG